MSARRDRARIFAARALVGIGLAIWGVSIPVAVLGRPVPPGEILKTAFILGGCPLVLGMTLLVVRVPGKRRRHYSSSQRGLDQMLLSDEPPPLEGRIATPPPSWKNAALSTAIVVLLLLLAVVIIASLAFAQVRYKDSEGVTHFVDSLDQVPEQYRPQALGRPTPPPPSAPPVQEKQATLGASAPWVLWSFTFRPGFPALTGWHLLEPFESKDLCATERDSREAKLPGSERPIAVDTSATRPYSDFKCFPAGVDPRDKK